MSVSPRRLAAVLVASALLVAAAFAASRASAAATTGPSIAEPVFDAGPLSAPAAARIARAAPAWRGGPITTATGETVVVRVSESLPVENTPEQWAGFLTGLVHGPELRLLTMYVATLDEVQGECGDRALGCYGGNQMIVPGETTPDGTTPEEVIRHEYGHHIAYNRVNTPWVAVDWGPKNWASAADVCGRVNRKEAFPGDEGSNYTRNPGEAWAETYRLMDERKVGITTASWQIISHTFYPSEAALQAAERDVVQPWVQTTTTSYKRVFPKKAKKAWLIPLATPLDGELRLTASLAKGNESVVALLAGDRKTVLQRAGWVGQRAKRLTTTVCGQRSLFVRVTPSGAAGQVRVSVTTP